MRRRVHCGSSSPSGRGECAHAPAQSRYAREAVRPPGRLADSQGSASGRFTRAIKQRNLFMAEKAMRELGTPSLLDALEYLDLAPDCPKKLLVQVVINDNDLLI
jgi:hypothetical protein